jgi:hypothetical protein
MDGKQDHGRYVLLLRVIVARLMLVKLPRLQLVGTSLERPWPAVSSS